MRDFDNLCTNCWEELTEGSVCAECGYDNDTQNDSINLKIKTLLADKYVVGKVIKVESDSVTYSGYDGQIEKPIYIREFFPKGIASRFDDGDEILIPEPFYPNYNTATKFMFAKSL